MNALFIVGAQRSGTTYLYYLLDAHPQICMARPPRPEPKFFLNPENFLNGKAHYESHYFKSFNADHLYIGEKSTSYIESRLAAERIKEFYPNARILMILRDPITRAYSNYRFSVMNGIESLSFQDALAAEPDRLKNQDFLTSVNPYAYQKRGRYMDYIDQYLKVFDREQINVIIYEEFIENTDAIAGLYRWLDLSSDFFPDNISDRVNASDISFKDCPDWENISQNLRQNFKADNDRLQQFLKKEVKVWQ